MTPNQITAALKMQSEGFKLDTIAERFHVSRTVLYYALKGRPKRKRDPAPLRIAKELWESAHSTAQRQAVIANFGDILGIEWQSVATSPELTP